MHLLYHLKAVIVMDSSSAALDRYEKFLTSLVSIVFYHFYRIRCYLLLDVWPHMVSQSNHG